MWPFTHSYPSHGIDSWRSMTATRRSLEVYECDRCDSQEATFPLEHPLRGRYFFDRQASVDLKKMCQSPTLGHNFGSAGWETAARSSFVVLSLFPRFSDLPIRL
eukprot:m.188195 g.188195  ORF g.188195 m.188195 type:complete len:104 (-) comp15080_c0_seq2:404-715(-)